MNTEEHIKRQVDDCARIYNSILETTMHKIQYANPVVQTHMSFMATRAQDLIKSIRELSVVYLHLKKIQEAEKAKHQNKGTK